MNLWLRVFLPFAVGYYLSYFLRNANAIIAPVLSNELALSPADLGLLTSTYLLVFGAFQIPLGILLDRYGPRKVEAGLLMIAAAGAALFAFGRDLAELALARGLIGLGVSACLMASFKGFLQWFPLEKQASLTGAIMAAGGLGALTASVPLELALPILGWRGAFIVLAVAALAAAAFIFFSLPAQNASAHADSLKEQLSSVAEIFRDRRFWRFAPQMALFPGAFMALQGLWAVPWLMNVSGASRAVAAEHLLAMGLAMLACNLGVATLATRLFVSTGTLAYALLAAMFPPALSGRVTTALNLLAFVGAFGLQWGIGLVVGGLLALGLEAATAYRTSFGVMFLMQASAYAWFVLEGRRKAV